MRPIERPLEPKEGRGQTIGEMISFGKHKDRGTGYSARSERVGPGVLVLHEFFGLTPSFKEKADRLNEAGFTALVPDLYDGRVASTVDEARSLAQSLDEDTVMARLGAAAEHLTANWHPRLGVVGFSLGAAFAVELAKSRDVEAVALYYGMGEMPGPRWKSPVLGHFAENDEWESHEYIQSFFEALEEIGADAESFVYPGTGHWFANPDVAEAYAPDAAEQAWNRTLDFFSHHLA